MTSHRSFRHQHAAGSPLCPRHPGRDAPIGRLTAIVLSALAVCCGTGRAAQGQEGYINRESEIQAAYLYNFGKYVDWPDIEDEDEFVIGCIGESPIREPLVKLSRTKTLNGKPIVVKQFRSVSDFESCHILFAPEGQNQELVARILEKARAAPTLIVGERRTSAGGAAMIRFYPQGNTLRFEIDPRSAERVQLKISAKLLALGKTIGP